MGQQDQALGFSSLQTNLQLNYRGLLHRENFLAVGLNQGCVVMPI